MMFGLIPKSWLIFTMVVIFVGTNAVSFIRGKETGEAFCEVRHERAATVAREAATIRAKEMKRSAEIVAQEVYDENQKQLAQNESLTTLTIKLHEAVTRASQATRTACPSTSTDGTATVYELFGECTNAYTKLAREADKVRGNVLGLQSYVRNVCQK